MRKLAERAARWLLLAALCCGSVVMAGNAAFADETVVRPGGYGAQERAAVDFSKKRTMDPRHRAALYVRKGGVPYFNHVRKDGRVTQRRLFRKRRVGRATVTSDLPPHLQRLEAWRARQGGAR